MTITVHVQTADFDMAAEYQALRKHPAQGAIVTFCGIVRELVDSVLQAMTLEHYPGMTEQALQHIAQEAQVRWGLGTIRIIHRVGQLHSNDQIVFVGVTSAHRAAAFAGAEFIMDYLKTHAPFWKKELTEKGEYWVEAKDSDELATDRWKLKK